MQPLFAAFRARAAIAFPPALQPHLAAHRELARAGVRLAFSSDLPVTPDPNPWDGLAAAVLDAVHALSPLAALRAYTAGGAYASREERVKGRLEPGQLADLQVYERDPLSAGPQHWAGSRPSLVMVGGAVAWRARP